MISKRTQREAIDLIKGWTEETRVPFNLIADLFEKLAKIKGNNNWKLLIEPLSTTLMMESRK